MNNFVLKLFSPQRQKRGFSFAPNIKHLQCVILAGHPCPAGYSEFFRVSLMTVPIQMVKRIMIS
ncbi:MAG: hypothetical protein CO187_07340 [Zetaproteobacteria bacterium CG_4_9_14_3_um_filter_53_7]|nr:MAG: hypothetical protein CO187_07340 [Zetaproteobacteria bacterium CG_4_9_14_3_um_filter_53_7]